MNFKTTSFSIEKDYCDFVKKPNPLLIANIVK